MKCHIQIEAVTQTHPIIDQTHTDAPCRPALTPFMFLFLVFISVFWFWFFTAVSHTYTFTASH